MWLFLFFSFALNPISLQATLAPTTSQSPAQPQFPTLIVQVVDLAWSPVPGAEVEVEAVGGKIQPNSAVTDNDGYARFFIPVDADYSIGVKFSGFKRERLKHMHLFKPSAASPAAYVQLRLHRFSGSATTVN
jgi:hypothetical protein